MMFLSFDRRLVRHILMSSAAMTLAAPAFAQEAPQNEVPHATGGLTDIIVTARKREENAQNIPVAATVVSAAQLDTHAINSVEKLVTMAPQLIVSRNGSGNGAAIGLRGISVNATSISLEQSVAIVIDSVYFSGGRALNMGMFDLARVEVLKGPQSLFYGKNTTAGAISFTTASPTKSFEAMARVGYEFKAQNPYVEGYVSGPIADTLSLRLAARYSKQFGALIRNVSQAGTIISRDFATGIYTPHTRGEPNGDTPGEENLSLRFSAAYDNDDGLTSVLKVSYNDYSSNTPNSAAVIGYCRNGLVQSDPTAPCGHHFIQVQNSVPADIAATTKFIGRHGGDPYLDYKAISVINNLTYDTDDVTISLVPAYTRALTYWLGDFDFTDNYLPTTTATRGSGGNTTGTRELNSAFSIEGRAQTSFKSGLNFMVGGYFQDSKQTFTQENIYPGTQENSAVTDPRLRYLTLFRDGVTNGRTLAAFGQILWDITPTLNVTGGVRYTHETKDSDQNQMYVNPAVLGSFAVRHFVVDQTFNNTSPEATITWKPTRQVTVYGSYKTGYKSGGFSISGSISPSSTQADAAFGPEKVKGWEGGVKSTLFDNQLRLNADVFYYKYRGIQADFFNPLTIQYLTLNAGSARTKGAEVEAEFAPRAMPGLILRGSAAYTDAIYTSFDLAPCVGGQTPAAGCNLAPNAAGTFTRQSLTGQRMPQAPKFTATFGADYDIPIGNEMKIGLSLQGRYSSRYKTYAFAPDNADRFFQKAYAAFDASIRLAQKGDKWEVAVIGKNLTNKFIVSSAFDLTYTGSGAGTAAGVPSDGRTSVYDPRTVAVQATMRF